MLLRKSLLAVCFISISTLGAVVADDLALLHAQLNALAQQMPIVPPSAQPTAEETKASSGEAKAAAETVTFVPNTGDAGIDAQLQWWHKKIKDAVDKKQEKLDLEEVGQFFEQVLNAYALRMLDWMETGNVNGVQRLHEALYDLCKRLPTDRQNADLATTRLILTSYGFHHELRLPFEETHVFQFFFKYVYEYLLEDEVKAALKNSQAAATKRLKERVLPSLKEGLEKLMAPNSNFRDKFPFQVPVYALMLNRVNEYIEQLSKAASFVLPQTGDKKVDELLQVIVPFMKKDVLSPQDLTKVFEVIKYYVSEFVNNHKSKVEKMHAALYQIYGNSAPSGALRTLLGKLGFNGTNINGAAVASYYNSLMSRLSTAMKNKVYQQNTPEGAGVRATVFTTMPTLFSSSLRSPLVQQFPALVAQIEAWKKNIDAYTAEMRAQGGSETKAAAATTIPPKEDPYLWLKLPRNATDAQILGLSPAKLNDEKAVKKAYITLVLMWHPDKFKEETIQARLKDPDIVALNLSDDTNNAENKSEKQKLVEEGFKLILNAYDRAMVALGKKERAKHREE
jgi:hypothetical protein